MLDHGKQALAALFRFCDRKRFHGRAQRGQRVAQFVGHVGRETLDRLDAGVERVRHVAQSAGQFADFIAPAGEVRDLDARADAPPDPFRAVGETPHRTGDCARKQHRQNDHDTGCDEKHFHDREPLGFHHVVNVGALCRQHQRATDRAEALYRHSNGDDHLAAFIHAHHACVGAVKRLRDFLITLAVLRAELVVEREIAAPEPAAQRDKCAFHEAGSFGIRWRKIEPEHIAATVQIPAVEDQNSIAIVDTRARFGRRHETPQHRRYALRVDRKFDAGQRFIGRAVAFAGLQFEKTLRIDRDGVGLYGRRRSDRAGNDFALREQTLHARINQAGAELREIEHAGDECDQAGKVEEDDAAREAREALRNEEMPNRAGHAAHGRLLLRLRARRLHAGAFRLGVACGSFPRFDQARRSIQPV